MTARANMPSFLPELFLQIHITDACDLRCKHCYMDRYNTCHMSREQFEEVLAQFGELCRAIPHRRRWVQITGGEPLMHPEWRELLRLAKTRVGMVRLMTNGVTIDRDIARELGRVCHAVQISVEGLEATNDSIRGAGTFRRALDGIRHLRRLGIFTSVKMTMSRHNQDEVLPLFETLKDELRLFSVARYVPCGPEEANLLPDPEVHGACIWELFSRWQTDKRVSIRDPFFGRLLKDHCRQCAFTGCAAGRNGLTVLETGEILPCRRLPISIGNVRNETLLTVYRDHEVMRRLRARQLKGRCGRCPYVANCGGARCIAWAVTRDVDAPDPGCPFPRVNRECEPTEAR